MKDLRVQRTYILLKDAFFKLLAKHPFEEIKVNDICNLAMIHRTTFYHHFQDKYDLLDFCIQDIERDLLERINLKTYKTVKEFYTNLVMTLLDYIADKKDIINNILKHNARSTISEVFISTGVNYIYQKLEAEEDEGISHIADINAMAHFYSGAVISTIYWWIESKNNLSEKEVCDVIIDLIFKVPHK